MIKDCKEFSELLEGKFSNAGFTLSSALEKIISIALSERDEEAKPCLDSKGNLTPDSDLRDNENVPLKEDIDKYFEREVKPYVSDAWIVEESRKKIGYEIPFTRHFYKYKPLRPLEEIDAEIRKLEEEISGSLKDLMK